MLRKFQRKALTVVLKLYKILLDGVFPVGFKVFKQIQTLTDTQWNMVGESGQLHVR